MNERADTATAIAAGHDRAWLPASSRQRESAIRQAIAELSGAETADRIETLIERNREIHELECINLNPATNVMNPRAEAALSAACRVLAR